MNNSNSLYNNRFRHRRFLKFMELVEETISVNGKCRIADVGGKMDSWMAFQELWNDLPITVTLLNLSLDEKRDPRFTSVVADGRDLRQFADNSFDLVFSNSVIEHVGGWSDQQRFAREVERIAPRHFVQTPNFWFPIEPHFRLPIFHWLPLRWRETIVQLKACGFYPRASTPDMAKWIVSDAKLLDATELAALFPTSRIKRERYFVTKSLIAVKSASASSLAVQSKDAHRPHIVDSPAEGAELDPVQARGARGARG